MHQEAIYATLERLSAIRKEMQALPVDATLTQMQGFIDERIAQYFEAMEKASPSPAREDDHTSGDILDILKGRIAQSKSSSLSKKSLREIAEALIAQQKSRTRETTETLDFEAYRAISHELLFLRQTSEDKLCLSVSNLISQHLRVLHSERAACLNHPTQEMAEAQAYALNAFLAYVDRALPSPLRKKTLIETLNQWELSARRGMPLI